MNNNKPSTIALDGHRHIYHLVTAVAEMALTEPGISSKLKRLILETQRETEEIYLLTSHDYYNNELNKGEMSNA